MKEKDIYKKAKIVVIDDVKEVLNSTKNCLEFEGMEVKTFSNPIEGLEYLKINKADVLLLDFFMPEMNGDEFVKELRKHNQETIVILQTGYSDKIPPLQMIDKMNIQGYLDKLKGEDELLLMTKAAIKTATLNKELRQKDRKIAILSYKKALVGDLIAHLVNASKDQLFQIGLMAESIKRDSDNYKSETALIKSAIDKIYELYEALNFENKQNMTITEIINTIKELLKVKILINNIKLEITSENKEAVIEQNADELVYLILKIIDTLTQEKLPEIKINLEKQGEKIIINLNSKINTEELELIAENLKFEIE